MAWSLKDLWLKEHLYQINNKSMGSFQMLKVVSITDPRLKVARPSPRNRAKYGFTTPIKE